MWCCSYYFFLLPAHRNKLSVGLYKHSIFWSASRSFLSHRTSSRSCRPLFYFLFKWQIIFDLDFSFWNIEVMTPPVNGVSDAPQELLLMKQFGWVDYFVFASMLVISLGIGIYYGCTGSKQRTTSEFFLGGRRQMGVFPVAMSLAARSWTPDVSFIYFTW